MCRFGASCKRKNPAHFTEENHPDDHPFFAANAVGGGDSAVCVGVGKEAVYAPAPGKPMCRFGANCKRKNPAHFVEENHPDDHPFFAAPGGGGSGCVAVELPATYSRDAWRPVLREVFFSPVADDAFVLFEARAAPCLPER
ncbi:hypothetical protein EMIHUDRAFT_249011, partial [Emiliania huxleyi CCMP1516]|uniref:PBZ-type domain-containing protein n=2 Tax=Emiliania huxleyi TaxID=2903 RepID=A0A0D3IBQ1_EMIH1